MNEGVLAHVGPQRHGVKITGFDNTLLFPYFRYFLCDYLAS